VQRGAEKECRKSRRRSETRNLVEKKKVERKREQVSPMRKVSRQAERASRERGRRQ